MSEGSEYFAYMRPTEGIIFGKLISLPGDPICLELWNGTEEEGILPGLLVPISKEEFIAMRAVFARLGEAWRKHFLGKPEEVINYVKAD